MDGFIDRFTGHKQNSGKGNSQAEARDKQEHNYRAVMEEIRKSSVQNTRNAEAVNDLLRKAVAAIQEAKMSAISANSESTDSRFDRAQKSLEETVAALEEMLGAGLRSVQDSAGANMALLQQNAEEKHAALSAKTAEMMRAANDNKNDILAAISAENAKIIELLSQQAENPAEAPSTVDPEALIAALSQQQERITEVLRASEEASRKTASDNRIAIVAAINAADAESRDFFHKESVKVYRNVQAVVETETAKQTEILSDAVTEAVKGAAESMTAQVTEKVEGMKIGKGLMPVAIITMIAALGNAAALICHLLGLI